MLGIAPRAFLAAAILASGGCLGLGASDSPGLVVIVENDGDGAVAAWTNLTSGESHAFALGPGGRDVRPVETVSQRFGIVAEFVLVSGEHARGAWGRTDELPVDLATCAGTTEVRFLVETTPESLKLGARSERSTCLAG